MSTREPGRASPLALLTLACLATTCAAAPRGEAPPSAADEPPAPPAPAPFGSPYLRPEMRELMEAVTLHISFDSRSATPDMAEGLDWTPRVLTGEASVGGLQYAPGLLGQALVLGGGVAVYPRAGNVLLESRGAIALWVKPEDWQRPNDRTCSFLGTSGGAFLLQRQGPMRGEDGKARRQEAIQYLVRDPGGSLVNAANWSPWTNGKWYLLIANWSWPTLELSINAQPLQGKSLQGQPAKDAFGALVVGDRGGASRGLLDEVMVFRRPLRQDEALLLYRLFAPGETSPPLH